LFTYLSSCLLPWLGRINFGKDTLRFYLSARKATERYDARYIRYASGYGHNVKCDESYEQKLPWLLNSQHKAPLRPQALEVVVRLNLWLGTTILSTNPNSSKPSVHLSTKDHKNSPGRVALTYSRHVETRQSDSEWGGFRIFIRKPSDNSQTWKMSRKQYQPYLDP
jgi:hypothetical protein